MSILTRSRKKPRNARLALQHLEEREVLTTTLDLNAATAAPKIFTFIDGTGDAVTIRLQGSSGSAIITSDDGGDGTLDDGENIQSISIVNPSSNFLISFAVDNSAGDGIIGLGEITANRTIRGVFTVADQTSGNPSDFQLTSFVGPGLSNGGSISVNTIVGNANGVGLTLTNGLGAKQSVQVSGDVNGRVTLGGVGLAGSINVGGAVASGNWQLATIATTGALNVTDNFEPNLTVTGTTAGSINIAGATVGAFNFSQDVLARARLNASNWADVNAQRNFGGSLNAVSGNVDLFVRGNLLGTANVQSADTLDFAVVGSVLSAAKLSAQAEIEGTVGGNFSGRITGQSDGSFAIGGSVIGGRINLDNNLTLNVNGSVLAKSSIQTEDDQEVVIRGVVADSSFTATTGELSISIGGAVTNAKFFASDALTFTAGGTVTNANIQGSSADVTVSITGSLVNSRVSCGSEDLSVSVTGNVVNSRLSALESDVTLEVGGNVTTTRITGEDIVLDINGLMSGSHVDAEETVSADIGGNLVDTVITALVPQLDGSITLDVGGDMIKSHLAADEIFLTVNRSVIDSVAVAGVRDITASIGGALTNSTLTALNNDIVLEVNGSVTASEIEAGSVVSADIAGSLVNSKIYGDEGSEPVTLSVGGDVIGSIVEAGDGDIAVAVTGNVRTSTFNASSNVTMSVGKSITDSAITAGSDLTLTVGGSVARTNIIADNDIVLTIAGSVSDSDISSSDSNITATIGGSVTNTTVQAQTDATLTIAGSVTATDIQADQDVELTIGGSYQSGSIQTGATALIAVAADFGASVDADELDIRVGRDVLASSIIQAINVADQNGDNIGFKVGRDFNGQLSASNLFSTGAVGSSETVVGRDVGSNAKINIAIDAANTADELIFAGFFRGELNIFGNLENDLTIGKDLAQASILGAVLADITVGGRVASLTTGSLFDQTSATTGDFVDQLLTITGTLTAGSIGEVDPRV